MMSWDPWKKLFKT